MKLVNKIKIFILIWLVTNSYAQSQENLSIIGVGDIMLGTNYPSKKYLPPNEGKDLLLAVNDILASADVTFGNLEGTLLDQGATIKTNCNNCYAFRMPEYLAQNLVTAGFDVLSLANNHVRDFGNRGLQNTKQVLDRLGIYAAGLVSIPSVTFEKGGVKYGFAAFAPNTGTVSINDIPNAQSIVRQLEQTADIVIVSFHGGAEGTNHQHVTRKREIYYGENRGNVYQFAHAVIDAGADIVFGHGPHVTRAVELYQDRFIAYSLGNFCTYGRFSLRGATSLAPIIKVKVDKTGQFVAAQITPIIQIKPGGVTLDPQRRVIPLIRQLTQADFPTTNLIIEDNGIIRRRSTNHENNAMGRM
jgi:poly-gamma-glutamate capsule biosynthesis protein CapA/YwtB (metallophosphatase superfamily)